MKQRSSTTPSTWDNFSLGAVNFWECQQTGLALIPRRQATSGGPPLPAQSRHPARARYCEDRAARASMRASFDQPATFNPWAHFNRTRPVHPKMGWMPSSPDGIGMWQYSGRKTASLRRDTFLPCADRAPPRECWLAPRNHQSQSALDILKKFAFILTHTPQL